MDRPKAPMTTPGHYCTVSVGAMFPDVPRDLTPLEIAESRARAFQGYPMTQANVQALLDAIGELGRLARDAGLSYAVDVPETSTPEAIKKWQDDQAWRVNHGLPRAVRYIGAAFDPEMEAL